MTNTFNDMHAVPCGVHCTVRVQRKLSMLLILGVQYFFLNPKTRPVML